MWPESWGDPTNAWGSYYARQAGKDHGNSESGWQEEGMHLRRGRGKGAVPGAGGRYKSLRP